MQGFAYPFSIAGFADGAPLDSIASGPPRLPPPRNLRLKLSQALQCPPDFTPET